MGNNTLLTKGNVFSTLIRFSLPFLLANVLQALYGAADLVIVGRFADPISVSAVANGSQIMQTVTGLIIGLATGGTVVIGQCFGAGDKRGVKRSIATIIAMFGVFSMILTAGMATMVAPICSIMRVPQEALLYTKQYLFICACGTVFIVGYNAISGVLRGLGDSRTPLIFIAVACAVNIAGDLALVAWAKMGAAGAALATIGAQAVSLVMSVIYLKRKGYVSQFKKDKPRGSLKTAGRVLNIGLPIALQEGLINISFLMITAIVNALGVTASAAVGVVEKIIVFSMLPTTAFASALAAMTAQHIGAGLILRAKSCLKIATALSLVFGVSLYALYQLDAAAFVRAFCSDAGVVSAGAAYLRSYSVDCIAVCFVFCFNSFFTGCDHALFPLVHSMLATFLVRVPLSYFLSRTGSMYLIGFAAPIATAISLIICEIYYLRGSFISQGRPIKRTFARQTPI